MHLDPVSLRRSGAYPDVRSHRNLQEEQEGYLSTEEWLLPDWEYLMKRLLMTEISGKVHELVETLKIDLPANDVHAWIKGPALVLDAVAVY